MTRINSVRPNIRAMAGYVPGEQPQGGGVIKLNTNENPYPPAPGVRNAVTEILNSGGLKKYPDPIGTHFREQAADVLGVEPDAILIGNGSDDVLTIVTRAFVPEGGTIVAPTPSYLLYRTLAEIQAAKYVEAPFTEQFTLPWPWPHPEAHLTFVPNPNSPTGTIVEVSELKRLAEQLSGVLVVDEAYVDFAETDALSLHRMQNVVVTRTLSKSYALAGLRFGFGVAHPDLIAQLNKVKDSYNCDALSLVAATAAVKDQEYLTQTRAMILATRKRLESALTGLGFDVQPSHANFVWCRRTDQPVKPIFEKLRDRKILVRYMKYPNYGDGLRITIGTDKEIDHLLAALPACLE